MNSRAIELSTNDGLIIQKAIVRSAGFAPQRAAAEVGKVALGAPIDAMRDCALFGLVRHFRRRHGQHRIELVEPSPKPDVMIGKFSGRSATRRGCG